MRLFRFLAYGWLHPLARRARFRALLNIMEWQVRSRLFPTSLRHDWIGDTCLLARRGMSGATGNIYYGLHEFYDMAFLLHFLRPGDCFVDVGANIGSYTVLASGVCKARSVCFEPDPETIQNLKANIAANGLDECVNVIPMAAGAEPGQLQFTVGLDTTNHVVYEDSVLAGATQTVAVTTLDLMVSGHDPSFIKIDVEGFEGAVIDGAQLTLLNRSLKAILLETVDDRVHEILNKHGFRKFYYDPHKRELSVSPFTNAQSTHNQLFVRDVADVVKRVKTAIKFRALGQMI